MSADDYKRDQWPVDEQGFNALDPASAEELGECYACIVGVWTGPESHSEGCPCRCDPAPVWPELFGGPEFDGIEDGAR